MALSEYMNFKSIHDKIVLEGWALIVTAQPSRATLELYTYVICLLHVCRIISIGSELFLLNCTLAELLVSKNTAD